MPRGGFREGTLKLRRWKAGKTQTIRVPIDLVPEILRLTKALDDGEPIQIGEPDPVYLAEVEKIISKYAATAKDSPRWDKANKLIAELQPLLV